MRIGADKKGLLTVGGRDPRVTRAGYFLRKYKLDELPQLFNVVSGEMSLVGPRPEVRRYVDLYSPAQREVLSVRPGITDYASIEYSREICWQHHLIRKKHTSKKSCRPNWNLITNTSGNKVCSPI
jgi:lipopolysaccharide/colanic/teichoic acid biosynthesis glycosyltransferase